MPPDVALELNGLDPMILNPYAALLRPTVVRAMVWFASYTLAVYDYVCTLRSEIQYVWPCGWSMAMVLFYFNRYLPFIDIIIYLHQLCSFRISLQDCLWLSPLVCFLRAFGKAAPLAVVMLRTHAIWGCRRFIRWILIFLATLTFGAMFGTMAWRSVLDYHRVRVIQKAGVELPPSVKCQLASFSVDNNDKLILLVYYLSIFISETAIFFLTLIKAKEHVSYTSRIWVGQLYRNGILYCVCMLVLSFVNSMVALAGPSNYKSILFPLQRVLTSIFANQVIFLILKHRKTQTSDTGHRTGEECITTNKTPVAFTSVYLNTIDGEEPTYTMAHLTSRSSLDIS